MKTAIRATIISTLMLSIVYTGGECYFDSKSNSKAIVEIKNETAAITKHDTTLARHEEMLRYHGEMFLSIKEDLEWIKRRMMK